LLILPLIDLLILSGTGLLVAGFVLKVLEITTRYHPSILGFSSLDFVIMTGVAWAFALVLAARSWVRLNEPKLLALKREQMQAEARRQAHELELVAKDEAREVRPLSPDPIAVVRAAHSDPS
jgi:hypothetical protein